VGSRAPERMAGLAKGLEIIEEFGRGATQMTVAEAAHAAGISRAAARRCLLTLGDLGFLAYDGKFFSPTPRLGRLGTAYLDTAPMPALARPHLANARDALGESVSLAVLDEGWSLFVARAEAERIVSAGVRVGARVPAYCSATGRVLLAALSEEALDRYLEGNFERRTALTVVNPKELRRLVGTVRAQGVAFVDEELELGLRALATPVKNSDGQTLAAMSVSTSTARATVEEMRQHFLPALRVQAERLGRML
jgi:IclR family pca regulon transcriptional regulator